MKSVSLFLTAILLYASGFGQCPVITVSGLVTDAPCFNQRGGSITLTVSGGSAPYTYQWSNSPVTKDLTNLYAGTYSVVVTDANGCKGTQSFTVAQPAEVQVSTILVDPTCSNSANGSITPTATGGTGPYTYQIEGGSANFSGLGAGTYMVRATDSRGCIGWSTVTLTAPAPIEILTVGTKKYLGYDVSCAGASNGEITVNAIGGTGALQYSVNSGAFQNSNVITGLSAGTYVVTVKDQNGCTLSNDYQSMILNPGIIISPPVTLVEPTPLELSPINANPWQLLGGYPNTIYQGYGPQWIVLSAGGIDGGTGTTFTYSWTNNTGAPISNPTDEITQSTPSQTTVYTLTVTDNNGCSASTQATVYVVDARCISENSNSTNKKVMMCHNGTEICVSLNSLSMSQHLAHGDRIGPCSFTGSKVAPGIQQLVTSDDEVAPVLEVHPNPSAGSFQLRIDAGKRVEIQVVDASGVVIERRMSGNKSLESFNLWGKPAGLYYIRTISAEGINSVKVWIRR